MSFACPGESSRGWGAGGLRGGSNSRVLFLNFPHELMKTQMSSSSLAERLVVITQSFPYAEHPSSPRTFVFACIRVGASEYLQQQQWNVWESVFL